MRLATFNQGSVGVVEGDHITELELDGRGRHGISGMRRIIESAAKLDSLRRGETHSLGEVTLSAPVPDPSKIMAAPVNYRDHQQEMNESVQVSGLGLFLKAPSSLTGSGQQIVLPYSDRRFDQEGELAVIIGRTARFVASADALDYVFGYSALLDITMRGGEDRSTRKSFETFTPMGPWLVTADEFGSPEDVQLTCLVNGTVRQSASTRDLIWNVAELVAYASSVTTLHPGDIISTGTPAGVGSLRPGDTVEVVLAGIGEALCLTVTDDGAIPSPTTGRDRGPVPPSERNSRSFGEATSTRSAAHELAPGSRTIDHHAHWYPQSLLKALEGREGYPALERSEAGCALLHPPAAAWRQPVSSLYFDLGEQFQDMAACGVDAMLASPATVFDTAFFGVQEARDLAMMANEEYAAAQRAYPGRFLGLATVPLQDQDLALEVLDDAIVRLGLKGVCMHANVGGSAICRPELDPVWDRIDELGVPVVLHPTRSVLASTYDFLSVPIDVMANWLLDTSAAALSLIMSGTLDRLPNLVVLHPHIGGVLPYLVGRLDGAAKVLKSDLHSAGKGESWKSAEPPSWYLKNRFWTDSSSGTPAALKMAVDIYGADRIMLGSDVPYLSRRRHLDYLREHLPAEQVETILTNRLPGLAA